MSFAPPPIPREDSFDHEPNAEAFQARVWADFRCPGLLDPRSPEPEAIAFWGRWIEELAARAVRFPDAMAALDRMRGEPPEYARKLVPAFRRHLAESVSSRMAAEAPARRRAERDRAERERAATDDLWRRATDADRATAEAAVPEWMRRRFPGLAALYARGALAELYARGEATPTTDPAVLDAGTF